MMAAGSDHLLTIALIGASVLYLVWRGWRSYKKSRSPSCGPSCGCH